LPRGGRATGIHRRAKYVAVGTQQDRSDEGCWFFLR
jgi:hypothetical protein